MKNKVMVISLFVAMMSGVALAEKNEDKLLDTLSAEASDTSMKEIKSDKSIEKEPEVETSKETNIDALSESVTKKLSGILGGNSKDNEKETEAKLEGLVTSALLDGVKMDDLRSAVSAAMDDISASEENAEKIEKASQSLDKLVGKSSLGATSTYVKAQQKEANEFASSTSIAVKVVASNLPETVTVEKGDSLYRIALRVYGKGDSYLRLYEANKDTISNPNVVDIGQVLRIPR